MSQSLNQADSRASSHSKSCCHSTRACPAPTIWRNYFAYQLPERCGAAPLTGLLLGSAEAIEATKSRLLTNVGFIGLHDSCTTGPQETKCFGVARAFALAGTAVSVRSKDRCWHSSGRKKGRRVGAVEHWEERLGRLGRLVEKGLGNRISPSNNSKKKKNSLLLLIFPAKLSSCSLPFVYWKGWVWRSVPFPRFTELLEGVAAAETCPGEKNCSELWEKMWKLAMLTIIRKQNFFLMFFVNAI